MTKKKHDMLVVDETTQLNPAVQGAAYMLLAGMTTQEIYDRLESMPEVDVLNARVAELEAENAALREAAAKKHEVVKRMADNIRDYMELVDRMKATMTTIQKETERRLAEARKSK